jgi:hypothetical protein
MAQTTAGQVTCDSTEHLRPFVVEWDATDLSSFEARAATDVVFVRYDKCRLEVLDGCTLDAVRGALGAYGAVTWTSGVLEKVDIQSAAALAAKLPLGMASLGGRVSSGEKFHMEYFVAGTRKATRAAVYRGDLEAVAGCRGATHFVYAYNLGAFALGSLTRAQAEAGATLWGVGEASAGGKHESAVEKRGGVLESCRGTSAQEIETCKAPIRLTLREIEAGTNPDQTAARAPETPAALNLAGKLKAEGERSSEANERVQAATAKLNAGDGKGCLSELDAADKLVTKGTQLSTEPQSYVAMTRARCLMESGQCEAGKGLLRRSLGALQANQTPEQHDGTVDAYVAMHCKGTDASPRDQVLRALSVLQAGAHHARLDARICRAAFETVLAQRPKVVARGPDDRAVRGLPRLLMDNATRCLGRAGDCAGALDATRRAAALVDADEQQQHFASGKRVLETFVSITRGACETQAIEGLTPLDVVRRSAATLDLPMSEMRWTAGRCQALYDEGRRAQARLARPLEPEARAATDALTTHAVACLDAAEDCGAAFRTHLDGYALNPRDVPLVRQVGAFDRWRARTCWRKRIDGLPREQRVLWLAELLDRERMDAKPDVAQCKSLLQEARGLVRPEDVDGGKNELRRTVLGAAASCLAKGGACAEGWAVERETRTRAPQSGEAARWADRFERCKGQKPE